LVLETSRELPVPVPSAAVRDRLLTRAEELGYARRDIAALYEVLARTPAAPGMTTQPANADGPAADRGGSVV